MYYYESHMGGIYTSVEYYDFDDLYCEECGDSDTFLGDYETFKEFAIANLDMFDYKGSGGYDIKQIFEDDGSITINELKKALHSYYKNKNNND